MSIMQHVKAKIAQMPPGQLITYAQFDRCRRNRLWHYSGVFKTLSSSGPYKTLWERYYYKPKASILGFLKPQERNLNNYRELD